MMGERMTNHEQALVVLAGSILYPYTKLEYSHIQIVLGDLFNLHDHTYGTFLLNPMNT